MNEAIAPPLVTPTFPSAFMVRRGETGFGDIWAEEHNLALTEPSGQAERNVCRLLKAAVDLVCQHRGDPGASRNVVEPIISGMRTHLNYAIGRRLDATRLDGGLVDLAALCGLQL